ncbi:gamma-glutamyltransferase [Pseudomonas aeruginosa]
MSFLNLPVRTLVAASQPVPAQPRGACRQLSRNAHAPQQAAVATPHPAATVAGLETLANGGNAFDAAAAIAAALAVAEPTARDSAAVDSSFCARPVRSRPIASSSARERAPRGTPTPTVPAQWQGRPRLSVDGPLAAAIPGLPAALVELSGRYGRKPLADNLVPAIRLAVDGVSVDRIYRDRAAMRLEAMRRTRKPRGSSSTRAESPTNGTCSANRSWHVPWNASGATGGSVSTKAGPRTSCSPGSAPAAHLERGRPARLPGDRTPPAGGGSWRASRTDQRTAALGRRRRPGARACRCWNSCRGEGRAGTACPTCWRSCAVPAAIEACSATRTSSPTRCPVAGAGLPEAPCRASTRAAPRPARQLPEAPAWREGDHTTHFAVIDAQGNAVAATLSVNLPFGAAFTVPGTGVVLNNEMDDFAADTQGANSYGLAGSQANAVAAGKRPLSSMSRASWKARPTSPPSAPLAATASRAWF